MKKWIEIAKSNGISEETFKSRVYKLKWDHEKAATIPVQKRTNRRKWIVIANENGISFDTYKTRVYTLGWTPKKAATTPVKKRRQDNDWIKIAKQNGIPKNTYIHRVDYLYWSKEEAATTPSMTNEEALEIGREIWKEHNDIIHKRNFNNPNNLFKITKFHLDIAESNGITKENVQSRIYSLGWTIEEAITKPVRKIRITKEVRRIAQINGIGYSTLRRRLELGWTMEDAISKKVHIGKPCTRSDGEWIKKAMENGINRNMYIRRVDELGWTKEEASTIRPLKPGEFSSIERKEKSIEGWRRFRRV